MSTTLTAEQVPLDKPLYGATFGQAISRFFKKYATFSGRASRSEYWWWVLASAIISAVLSWLSYGLGAAGVASSEMPGLGTVSIVGIVLTSVWGLAILIPSLALTWRRLHDTNRSGAFFFLIFIPLVGSIILFVFTLLQSDPAGARFDEPTASGATAAGATA